MKKRIILFRVFFGLLVFLILFVGGKYLFYRDAIDGQLIKVQTAQNIGGMMQNLNTLKVNLEKYGFTSGYTSFLYQALGVEGANMAIFYENIKNRQAELKNLSQQKAEKTFDGIKAEINEMTPPLAFYYFTQTFPWFLILFCLTYLWTGLSIVSYAGWNGGVLKILWVNLKEFGS